MQGINPMMNKPAPVVTIDGPGSSGKGTVGRLLARTLGWHFLDSGALYRALAFMMDQEKIAVEDKRGLEALTRKLNLEFEFISEPSNAYRVKVLLNGKDVTQALLTESCGNRASEIAVFPQVREALLEKQRAFRKPPGLVADGRDMGSVIFPNAELKIFLSASVQERARRRYRQLKEQGINVSLGTIETELKARDERDEGRSFAPLKSAEDAILVDTTDVSIAKVVEHIEQLIRERLGS
jgi:CMP/dCMP kinase